MSTAVFGGGKAGLMGVSALESHRAGVTVHGITLPFFAAAQGEEDPLVKSVQRVFSMADRKKAMRDSSKASFTVGGGNGSLEEKFEWLNSRNGIIKPVVSLNVNGFDDGLKTYVEALVEGGYVDHGFLQRIHFESSPEAFVERAKALNAQAPLIEKDSCAEHVDLGRYIKDYPNAVLVYPGPPEVAESIMERLVIYDLCNIPGVELRDAQENNGKWDVQGDLMYLPERVLKPIVFVSEGGHFDGLRQQFGAMHDNGFVAADRKRFVRFADYADEAEDMARELENEHFIRPEDVALKHSEAERVPDSSMS